ncbi:MAG TPA: AI-2E family transporter [Anaeromyxobacter sp.]|nr:AI-2E family transporter [Anaeromyxobacter sp.]
MSEVHARRLLVFLVVAALALTALLIKPFWVAFFTAAVIAAALRPAQEWLSARLRGRRAVAATLLTIGVLVLVVLPIATMGTILVNEVLQGVAWLRKTIESEGVWGLLGRLPVPVQSAAKDVLDAIPQPQEQLQKLAGERGAGAATAVGGAIAWTGTALFQTGMMLIALCFLLIDGRRLVSWIDGRVPLKPGQFRMLLEDFRATSVSVLVSTLGTAAAQAVVAGVGYFIARAPNALFLVLATFLVSLIPVLGGFMMVGGVALLMFATGRTFSGVFLVAWAAVVWVAEHVVRPYLLKGGMELHGGVVFFALLGGLAAFGSVGLLLGPLVLTFLVATMRLYRAEFGRPGQSDRAA